MKASELIERLNHLVVNYGDRDVGIYNAVESEFDEVDGIRARHIEGTDRRTFDGVFFGITSYEIGDWKRQDDIKEQLR